ncbi:MAG: O-antigen ligase family protein [Bryobacteraceae bacterium]
MTNLAWLLLCAFVFSLPWEKSIQVEGLGTISRVLGMLAVTAGALAAIQRRSVRAPNLAFIAATLFTGWTALTWCWSIAPPATAARAATFAQLLVMAWLIWDLCRTRAQQDGLLRAYVAGAVVSSLYTLSRFLQGEQTYYRRYATAGFDPNDLGLTVALSIPFGLYLALRSRGPAQWLYRLAAACAIGAVLLTASRSALIVTFLAFGFAVWTWRQSGLAQKLSTAALLAVLLLGLVRLAPAPSRQRLATLPTEITQGTLHKRTTIWKSGLKALKQHPVLGTGVGTYPEAVRPWLGTPQIPGHEYVAHNAFLSVLVESGLIGFSLFAALLGILAVYIWIMPMPERALWATTLAMWAVGVSTLTWEHRKPGWLIFALIMAAWARSFEPREKQS